MERITKVFSDIVKPYIDDEVSARAALGAHNLGKKYNGVTSIGITLKDAPDGGNYVNGTAASGGGRLNLKSDNFVLKAGTYSIVGESNDHSKYSSVVLQKTSDNSVLGSYLISNGTVDKSQATVTLAADTECYFGFNTSTGTAYGTDTFIIYPMVKLADDKDDTFYPYAMTNRELTEGLKQKATAYVINASYDTDLVTSLISSWNKLPWGEPFIARVNIPNIGNVFVEGYIYASGTYGSIMAFTIDGSAYKITCYNGSFSKYSFTLTSI